MIPAFPVYLFDIDGTLVDSAEDICGAIQTVLSTTTRPDVDRPFLKRYIGYHLIELFGDLFPHKSHEEIDQLVVRVPVGVSCSRTYSHEALSWCPRDDFSAAGPQIHRNDKGYTHDAPRPGAVRTASVLCPCSGNRWVPLQAAART